MAKRQHLHVLGRGVLATSGFRRKAKAALEEDELTDLVRELSDDPHAGKAFRHVNGLAAVACGGDGQAQAIYLLLSLEAVEFVVLLDLVEDERAFDLPPGPDLDRILQLCDRITRLVSRALEWLESSGLM